MMIKKLQLPLAALFVFACLSLSGQKILHKANKQFDLKHYHEAIDSYQKTLEKHPDNLEAKSNLAEAYRMTNQLSKAEEAYAQIMPEEFVDPIYIRNYGITLMKMAKYTQAHYQFELYKIYNPQDAQHYQLSCEFAHHLYRTQNAFEVELVGVNTPNSDFGVAFMDDRLIFSSFRNDVELSDAAKLTGQNLSGNMLYIADVGDDLRATNVKFLRSGIAEKKNIGPISFAPQAQICAFTRNKIQNGGAHVTGDDSYHSIYIGDLQADGSWNNERPFRYNEFGTSTGFPSLAFDGSALYFASNRVGGFGGYDIYVSYWKENSWTYPENLGSEVNTSGNEITPFYNGEDLYFASDYHHGMGGYDIFHSLTKGGKWTHPENMANGINSPADDYYPTIKEGTEGIFFSSNRLGGRGMDDIYLAVPVENEGPLANLDFVPDGVTLASMDSRIVEPIIDNPSARTVSSTSDVMQITILNSDPNNTNPDEDLSAATLERENAELQAWGFAVPPEAPMVARADVSVEVIKRTHANLLANKTETVATPEVRIMILDLGSPLDQYIARMDEEELQEALQVDRIAISDQSLSLPREQVEEAIVDAEEQIVAPVIEMEEVISEPVNKAKEVANAEAPDSYKIPNYKAISASRAPLNLDLAGAKRVALGEILPSSDVYFIQLAALSKTTGNVDKFKSLAKYGNLYKVFKSTSTKIKLGYFLDKQEAEGVLRNVKTRGYKDAFITKDDLGSMQLELIVANDTQKDQYTSYDSNPSVNKKATTSVQTQSATQPGEFTLTNRTRENSYKIRLASYEDPIWFDIEKAKQLGKIEQWTKGSWTIFILGGYSTYADAEQAMIKAVNKGFADAEIVIDNNGILERLKQN